LLFLFQPVDVLVQLTFFSHPFFMELRLFGLEINNFLVKFGFFRGVEGLDFFELFFVDLDLFFETGDGDFVLGNEFVSVFEGINLHGGETVVGEFEELDFRSGLIEGNLVQELFEGARGGLAVLDPLFFDGLVGFFELGESSSVAIKFFFEGGYF
jgi:hypothetical protein